MVAEQDDVQIIPDNDDTTKPDQEVTEESEGIFLLKCTNSHLYCSWGIIDGRSSHVFRKNHLMGQPCEKLVNRYRVLWLLLFWPLLHDAMHDLNRNSIQFEEIKARSRFLQGSFR